MNKDLLDEITDIEVLRVNCRQLNKLVMIKENKLDQQQQEIERLKDLCDKYEEEHKTTFEEWKKTINIIKEVREYIKDNVVVYAFNNKDLPHWELNDDNVKELLEILDKGSDKE